MCQNPQFLEDLVTFTGEILNGKLHFLCGVSGRLAVIKWSVCTVKSQRILHESFSMTTSG